MFGMDLCQTLVFIFLLILKLLEGWKIPHQYSRDSSVT